MLNFKNLFNQFDKTSYMYVQNLTIDQKYQCDICLWGDTHIFTNSSVPKTVFNISQWRSISNRTHYSKIPYLSLQKITCSLLKLTSIPSTQNDLLRRLGRMLVSLAYNEILHQYFISRIAKYDFGNMFRCSIGCMLLIILYKGV